MMLISPIEGEQLVSARVREKQLESLRKELAELKEQLYEMEAELVQPFLRTLIRSAGLR
jgi:ribosomal protein L29